jgi:hypothetical protein
MQQRSPVLTHQQQNVESTSGRPRLGVELELRAGSLVEEIKGLRKLLAIAPQLLSYFLSGLSGSASAPKFVLQIQTIITWSFVKFFAALGGISSAQFFSALIAGKSPVLRHLASGLASAMLAFLITLVYFLFTEWVPAIRRERAGTVRPWPPKAVIALHGFFTRNTTGKFAQDDRDETRKNSSLPKI